MCLIKFNDYFEFPRTLDMEPYTVGGLAKIEGEAIDCDPSDLDSSQIRKYRYVLKYRFDHCSMLLKTPKVKKISSKKGPMYPYFLCSKIL